MTRSSSALALIPAALLLAVSAHAVTPGQINYQGLLLGDQGAPITGAVDLVFRIFDVAEAGTSLWTETHPDVPVLDGVYDVLLGASAPITPGLVAGGALYLEIQVEGETLTPRQRLVAVPYAVHADTAAVAETADSVGGIDAGYVMQIVQHVDFDGAAPPNDDPSEGLADPDGDGRANFIDADNDGDGLSDTAELGQQSDINLITPTITDIQPEPAGASVTTTVTVTGTNFEPGLAVSFGSQNPTPQNLTATSFDVAVGMQPAGIVPVEVTRTNGESASTSFEFSVNQPLIDSFDPEFLPEQTGGTITIHGSGFASGVAVTFGSESPTPVNVTPTSLDVTVGPQPAGVVDVTVFFPGPPSGGSDTATFGFVDTSQPKRVFVTSTSYTGNLGGIAGANAKCAARASAASLTGTYLAWVGDGTGDPDGSFTKSYPYYQVNASTAVATGYASLTDGNLNNPIDRDEFGNPQFDYVWTNVDVGGMAQSLSCLNWSSAASSDVGGLGSTAEVNGGWTAAGAVSCNQPRRLYCFEQ